MCQSELVDQAVRQHWKNKAKHNARLLLRMQRRH